MVANILPFTPRRRSSRRADSAVSTPTPTTCGEYVNGLPVHVWRQAARLHDRCICGSKVLDCTVEPAELAADF